MAENSFGVRVGLENLFKLLGGVGASPFHGDFDGVDAVGFTDLSPTFAELSADDDENLVAGGEEVGDGGFHGAGSGAGEGVDVVLRLEDILHTLGHLHEDVGKLFGAVVDDGKGGFGQNRLGDGRRAGREQVVLFQHMKASMVRNFIKQRKNYRPKRVACKP